MPPVTTVTLSEVGIRSDADLSLWSTDHGEDQTSQIQAVLDRARGGGGLHIIWDVSVSVTGLKLPHGVTVEPLPGCGAILRPGSNRPLLSDLQSYLRPLTSRDRVTPANEYTARVSEGVTEDGYSDIHVLPGGVWNCNGWNLEIPEAHYPHDTAPRNDLGVKWEGANQLHHTEEDGWTHGIRLVGVRGSFSGTVLNSRCFGVYLADFDGFSVEQLTIIQQREQRPDITGNTDGLHLGRGRRLRVHGLRCSWTGDDFFAIVNAPLIDQLFAQDQAFLSEYFPFTGPGDTSDIVGTDILGTNCLFGLRFLSGQPGLSAGGSRISNVKLSRVRGSIVDGGKWLSCQQYTGLMAGGTPHDPLCGPGNVGDIDLHDLHFKGGTAGEIGQNVDKLTIRSMRWDNDLPLLTTEFESYGMELGTIELRDISCSREADDGRGLIHHVRGSIKLLVIENVRSRRLEALVTTTEDAVLEQLHAVSTTQQDTHESAILRHNSSQPVLNVIARSCRATTLWSGEGRVLALA